MTVRNRKAPAAEPDFANALGMITKIEADDPLSKEERTLLRSNALTVEDDPWQRLSDEVKQNIMSPTLNPVQLQLIVQQNNTLMQCIDAMEINIDGTGFDIEKPDGVLVGKDEDNLAKEFFETIYPGKTITQIRRQMRRDKEGCGGGYLEVMRDSNDEIALCDWLDAKLTRLVRLDNPVVVKQTIKRGGKDLEVEMVVRERRFAMLIGNRVRYFREFGSSRHVNKVTGEWMGPVKGRSVKETKFPKQKMQAAKGRPNESAEETEVQKSVDASAQFSTAPMPESDIRPEKQLEETSESALHGSEILYFPLKPDVTTMYGVPRWVNQLPSALGSRAAEELNLEYFKHGGVPPMIMMLMGGKLSPDSRTSLNSYLAAPAKMKQRGVIAEIYSTSGAINATNQVKATIERFGGERQTDSMFEDYDDNCHERIRSSFRLPPLFVGHAEAYSYATAYASYLVAEAQVFKPERDLFDEVINSTIMAELFPDYKFRSRDLSITDIQAQLQGLEMVKDSVQREDWVDEISKLLDIALQYQDPMDDPHKMAEMQTQMQLLGAKQSRGEKSGEKPNGSGGNPAPYQNPLMKQDGINKQDAFLRELAVEWAGVLAGDTVRDAGSQSVLKRAVEALPPDVRQLFNAYVAARMVNPTEDPQGVAELLSCAGEHTHNGA